MLLTWALLVSLHLSGAIALPKPHPTEIDDSVQEATFEHGEPEYNVLAVDPNQVEPEPAAVTTDHAEVASFETAVVLPRSMNYEDVSGEGYEIPEEDDDEPEEQAEIAARSPQTPARNQAMPKAATIPNPGGKATPAPQAPGQRGPSPQRSPTPARSPGSRSTPKAPNRGPARNPNPPANPTPKPKAPGAQNPTALPDTDQQRPAAATKLPAAQQNRVPPQDPNFLQVPTDPLSNPAPQQFPPSVQNQIPQQDPNFLQVPNPYPDPAALHNPAVGLPEDDYGCGVDGCADSTPGSPQTPPDQF